MKPRALTPFFQGSGRRPGGARPDGVQSYPAPASGNHAGEAVFLAISTALLAATAVAPLVSGIPWPWLRWPLAAVLLFLLPHAVMALISLVSGPIAGTRWHRGVVQDWSCLAFMTAYAGLRAASPGWPGWICQGWLVFMALNALIGFARIPRRGGRSSR